jgi:putative lipoprotein
MSHGYVILNSSFPAYPAARSSAASTVLGCLLLAAALPGFAFASDAIWQGSFIAKGAEAGMFSPCRSGKRYTTHDATATREVASLYYEIAQRAGRPVFIEFIGAQEAEDRLRIGQVLRAAARGPGCGEDSETFELRAYGASPPWRLDVSPAAMLFQAAALRTSTWAYRPFAAREGRRELVGQGEAGRIEVTITPGRCVDELASAVFNLRAEVLFEGRTYQGCAYEGALSRQNAPR